jgi:uncharacterized protein (TIGR02246 family)
MRTHILSTAAGILLALPAFATEYRGGTKADYAAIEGIEPAWRKAYAARDIDALVALYTEDAWIMARGRPAKHGHAEFRKGFETLVAGVSPELVSEIDELVVRGNWAWTVAKFKITYTPLNGGAPRYDYGRSLLIYEKGKDGRWRIARDIDTPSPDAQSLDARKP